MAASRPAGRSSDIILLKSTAAILAAAMFVGDRTTASTSLAGSVYANNHVQMKYTQLPMIENVSNILHSHM